MYFDRITLWVDAVISNRCRGSISLGVYDANHSACCIWLLPMTCDCALAYVQSFNTALLLAAKHGKIDTIRVLVNNGANIEAKNTEVVMVVHIIHDKSQADN